MNPSFADAVRAERRAATEPSGVRAGEWPVRAGDEVSS